WCLSKRLGVSVDELRAANPDLNKNGDYWRRMCADGPVIRNKWARPQESTIGRDSLQKPNSLFTAILSLTRHTHTDIVATATTLIASKAAL
ncbi:MAG: hypothetical protein WC722_16520, partial [Rhodospirillales bacterium]